VGWILGCISLAMGDGSTIRSEILLVEGTDFRDSPSTWTFCRWESGLLKEDSREFRGYGDFADLARRAADDTLRVEIASAIMN